MSSKYNIFVDIIGNSTQLMNSLRHANSGLQRFSNTVSGISTSLLAFGIRAGVLGTSISLMFLPGIRDGVKFQQTMSAVRAVVNELSNDVADASGKFKDLTNLAIEMGRTTQYSATQAAEAMVSLGQAGLSVTQITSSLKDVLDLAAAGGLSTEKASEIASDALQTFGIQAENTSRVVNTLSIAADVSTTDVLGLSRALKYASPIAAGLGQSIEDVTIALAMLSNKGIKGSTAGTGLANVMSTIITKSEEADRILRKYGSSFDAIDPRMNSIIDIANTFREAGVSVLDVYALFEQRAGRTILALRDTSVQSLEQIQEAMDMKFGKAAEKASTRTFNLAGALTKLKSAFQSLSIDVFNLFSEKMRLAVLRFRDFVNKVSEFVKANPQLVASIVRNTLAFGALVTSIGLASVVLSNFIGMFSSGVSAILRFSSVLISLSEAAPILLALTSGTNAYAKAADEAAIAAKAAAIKAGQAKAAELLATQRLIAAEADLAKARLLNMPGAVISGAERQAQIARGFAGSKFKDRVKYTGQAVAAKAAAQEATDLKNRMTTNFGAIGLSISNLYKSAIVPLLTALTLLASAFLVLAPIVYAVSKNLGNIQGISARVVMGFQAILDALNPMKEWASVFGRIQISFDYLANQVHAAIIEFERLINTLFQSDAAFSTLVNIITQLAFLPLEATLHGISTAFSLLASFVVGLTRALTVLIDQFIWLGKTLGILPSNVETSTDAMARFNRETEAAKTAIDGLEKSQAAYINTLKRRASLEQEMIDLLTKGEERTPLENKRLLEILKTEKPDDFAAELKEREKVVKNLEKVLADSAKAGVASPELEKNLEAAKVSIEILKNLIKTLDEGGGVSADEIARQLEEELAIQEALDAGAPNSEKRMEAERHLRDLQSQLNRGRLSDIEEEVAALNDLTKRTLEANDAILSATRARYEATSIIERKAREEKAKKLAQIETIFDGAVGRDLTALEEMQLENINNAIADLDKQINNATVDLENLNAELNRGEANGLDIAAAKAERLDKLLKSVKRSALDLIKEFDADAVSSFDKDWSAIDDARKRSVTEIDNSLKALEAEKTRIAGEIFAPDNTLTQDQVDALYAESAVIEDKIKDFERIRNLVFDAADRKQSRLTTTLGEGRTAELRKLEIEEAQAAENFVRVAELEAEQRVEEAKKMYDEIFALDGQNDARILEQRKEAEDKLAALNARKIEEAKQKQNKAAKESVGFTGNKIVNEGASTLAKQVKTARDLLNLYIAIRRIRLDMEQRAALAVKKSVQEENKLANLQKATAKEADPTKLAILKKKILESKKLSDLYNAIAAGKTLEVGIPGLPNVNAPGETTAPPVGGVAANAGADLDNLVAKAQSSVNVIRDTLVPGIRGIISEVATDFGNAPNLWVSAFIDNWYNEAGRIIEAVRDTMRQLKEDMRPDVRHSPSMEDVWSMNLDTVSKGVGKMASVLTSGGLNLSKLNYNSLLPASSGPSLAYSTTSGIQGGITRSLVDNRSVAMNVNTSFDADNMKRIIGNALERSIGMVDGI